MCDTTCSQATGNEPALPEGVYLARIIEVECSPCPQPIDDYVRLVFWLPELQVQATATFQFPGGEESRQSMRRLLELCRSVGLTPPLRSPGELFGRSVAIRITSAKHGESELGADHLDFEPWVEVIAISKGESEASE